MRTIRCSALPRYVLCNGAYHAEAGIESEDSAQSIAGNEGHDVLRFYWLQPGHITGEELKPIEEYTRHLDDMTASRAHWYANTMTKVIAEHGGARRILTETPMSVTLSNGFGKVKLTGHTDIIVVCKDGITLISDWKFNFLEVPEAAHNIQLMGYAYLVVKDAAERLKIPVESVHTILVAGGNERPYTAAVYDENTIDRLEKHLLTIVDKCLAEDARRIPDEDACKYCLAKCTQRCPESIEELKNAPVKIMKSFRLLPSQKDCVKMFIAVKMVESFGKKLIKDLKAIVKENPEDWAHLLELCNTGMSSDIKNPPEVYKTFVEDEKLITHDQFMEMITIPIGKLQDACKPTLKERKIKVKDQRDHIEKLLGDNLEKTEKEKSLKAVKNG